MDYDYAAKLTALNAVSLAGMSWAPEPPQNVDIRGAVHPSTPLSRNDARGEENVMGYKVYWRLTSEPQWQWSRYVGDVNEYTLEIVVIDNYIFGVASVSPDGFESPVVFPGPAGEFSIEFEDDTDDN